MKSVIFVKFLWIQESKQRVDLGPSVCSLDLIKKNRVISTSLRYIGSIDCCSGRVYELFLLVSLSRRRD